MQLPILPERIAVTILTAGILFLLIAVFGNHKISIKEIKLGPVSKGGRAFAFLISASLIVIALGGYLFRPQPAEEEPQAPTEAALPPPTPSPTPTLTPTNPPASTATLTPTNPPPTTPAPTPTPMAAIPTPELTLTGTESYEAAGKQWVRYNMAIANRAAFPAELFEPAPDLPPCGSNTEAARTWVDIYDAADDSRLYGFCAFSSPQSLNSIWFAIEQGESPPEAVYVSLRDRKEDTTYPSNKVPLP